MALKEQILDYLREHPGATDTELEQAVKKSHQTVNYLCRKLEQQGALVRRKEAHRYPHTRNYLAEREYAVNLTWDESAERWTAQSGDIPGLALECGSLDALMERVRYAVPELLEENGLPFNAALAFRMVRRVKVQDFT